ncbi:MAG: isoprenylcysteine carboxylmethyltransferase family protein [Fibrobacter sp.]|nr:isoprenylcysteine carboxylmethyltransferase family protein [Fibrobacter sp.]
MKRVRDFFGYLLGGILFVALIPTIMWLASGMPDVWPVGIARAIGAAVLMLCGLVLSVYTIVYMRNRGKGNPMDAFGHEVAPRTQHLMIEGPYKINRNPMLTGTLVYLAGAAVWLWTWQSVVVLVAFFAIMMVQVFSEERRLRRDFGEEYEEYYRHSRRF